MQVTVSVALDDGTEVKRSVRIDSSGNPLFWSHGIDKGAELAVQSIRCMVEAEYGLSEDVGIHVVR